MNKDIYLKLKNLKNILNEQYGIKKIALVGSQAREDYRDDSDIDLVVIEGKKDYFLRFKAIEFLSKNLGKKVDLVYFDSIRPVIKKHIKKDLISV